METYMIDVLRKAEEEAYMVVFELDTPGGLVSSMTEITKQITQARVPVVMWVYPSGARAASRGFPGHGLPHRGDGPARA